MGESPVAGQEGLELLGAGETAVIKQLCQQWGKAGDDGEIRRLNRQFLERDRATDVIAFSGEGDLLGEIAVSIDTARRQARARGVSLESELKLLAVHGFLHLTGYDDLSLPAWRKMKQAEFETVIAVL